MKRKRITNSIKNYERKIKKRKIAPSSQDIPYFRYDPFIENLCEIQIENHENYFNEVNNDEIDDFLSLIISPELKFNNDFKFDNIPENNYDKSLNELNDVISKKRKRIDTDSNFSYDSNDDEEKDDIFINVKRRKITCPSSKLNDISCQFKEYKKIKEYEYLLLKYRQTKENSMNLNNKYYNNVNSLLRKLQFERKNRLQIFNDSMDLSII